MIIPDEENNKRKTASQALFNLLEALVEQIKQGLNLWNHHKYIVKRDARFDSRPRHNISLCFDQDLCSSGKEGPAGLICNKKIHIVKKYCMDIAKEP